MGEARRRGTFEERREQAITAGRMKRLKLSARRCREIEGITLLHIFGPVFYRSRRRSSH